MAGVVASRAQWRFGIFAFGLQMAITLNQINYPIESFRTKSRRHTDFKTN